jgi:hypothetical protein
MTPQEVLAANPPIYFERNLRNIAAIAQANNVTPVFSTWAYWASPLDDTTNVMSRDYYQQGVAEHNVIIRALGSELEIPVIDLARELPLNRDYWLDTMHMSETGTTEQAHLYAAYLVENNLLPLPK